MKGRLLLRLGNVGQRKAGRDTDNRRRKGNENKVGGHGGSRRGKELVTVK